MPATSTPTRVRVQATINGEESEFLCEPRQSLLEVLRETLGLTGTKEGCNDGNCGACSVIMDGRLVNACLVLATEADGAEITTIEGLASNGELHPMQEAFREHHGLQCGFCTPGMVMAAVSLVQEHPNPTEEEVRKGLEGNLCRCTGYHNIVKAVMAAGGSGGGA
jgi:aerobic carbon-monoxide dehydrogenase small subunit